LTTSGKNSDENVALGTAHDLLGVDPDERTNALLIESLIQSNFNHREILLAQHQLGVAVITNIAAIVAMNRGDEGEFSELRDEALKEFKQWRVDHNKVWSKLNNEAVDLAAYLEEKDPSSEKLLERLRSYNESSDDE
jgi:hypothetical protein